MLGTISVRNFILDISKEKSQSIIKKKLVNAFIEQNNNINILQKACKGKHLSIYITFHFNWDFGLSNDFDEQVDKLSKIIIEVLNDQIDDNESGLGLIDEKRNDLIVESSYSATFVSNVKEEGIDVTISEYDIKPLEKGLCEFCREPLNDCQCGYTTILDVPTFIHRRSQHIFNKKRCKITEFKEISFFIIDILNHMPNVYYTRSGEEVEDYYIDNFSDHDGARYIGTSIMHEMNELLVNLTVGSYDSSIRSIRNLFEWTIRTTVAISNAFIITKRIEDKNLPSCFHVIKEAYRISENKSNMDIEKRKLLEKLYKNDVELDEKAKAILMSDIGFGVKRFIRESEPDLLKYISLNNSEIDPKKSLIEVYNQLSQFVHKGSELLENMEQNQGKIFFNSEEFDYTYNLLYDALDCIFYFYLLLLDLDVFHSNLEWKMKWRKNIRIQFHNMILSGEKMQSTRRLVDCDEWNANPPIELISYKKT